MIEPRPSRPSTRMPARQPKNVASSVTAKTARQSSSGISSILPNAGAAALFTSTSRRPCGAAVSWIIAVHALRRRHVGDERARPRRRRPRSRATTASAPSARMSFTTTCAPSAAKRIGAGAADALPRRGHDRDFPCKTACHGDPSSKSARQELAAVHVERGAGDGARVVRHQEERGLRALGVVGDAPERDALRDARRRAPRPSSPAAPPRPSGSSRPAGPTSSPCRPSSRGCRTRPSSSASCAVAVVSADFETA